MTLDNNEVNEFVNIIDLMNDKNKKDLFISKTDPESLLSESFSYSTFVESKKEISSNINKIDENYDEKILIHQSNDISTKTVNIWNEIEKKWINYWDEKGTNISDPDYNKEKFFLTVAYPYPNSPQHIGHGRTYTLADVHARYFKLKGFNVLFPMGFHYTGTPILGMSKRVKSRDVEIIQNFKKIYEIDQETIESFEDPLKIAKYFHNEIKIGMKEMGYSIDWRREFTTVDIIYKKLISWQFKTLKDLGVIEQGSHPVGWCPNDGNPVSQHDTLGDVEPSFTEYLLIKFKIIDKNIYLPVATLRPETIYGVTNLWINPHKDYVLALINESEQWVLSKDAVKKLEFLNYSIKILNDKIPGSDFIKYGVENPLNKIPLPILPATFVTMGDGSGIVMSVPAHAPFDMQALIDYKANPDQFKSDITAIDMDLKPIKIIDADLSKYTNVKQEHSISKLPTNSEGIMPSEFFLIKYAITNQADPNLEKATSDLYSLEFYGGTMNLNTPFPNVAVSEAKDIIKDKLYGLKLAIPFYELTNKPVYCRCGSLCYVKILENQWFLNYGNPNWKNLAFKCLNNMEIFPNEIVGEFKNVFDWLKERACARKSGLGTKLPWDEEWIIESLSDSVIYMVYYIIAKYVNTMHLEKYSELIDDSFFDYVLLDKKEGNFVHPEVRGNGDPNIECGDKEQIFEHSKNPVPSEFLLMTNQIKKEFEYYYPIDSRHSGRDLVPNHLSFFIFNHAIIFPQKYWPKQIIVNGSVLMEGKKMSKSMGNIVPLRKTIKQYNADSIRVAMLILGELLQDVDFSFSILKGIYSKLNDLYNSYISFYKNNKDIVDFFLSVNGDWIFPELDSKNKIKINELSTFSFKSEDKWLLSRINNIITEVTNSFEEFRIRDSLNQVLYLMDKDFDWYKRRKNSKQDHTLNYDGSFKLPESDAFTICYYMIIRLKLLSPFCPFLAEEINSIWGKGNSIFNSKWPQSIDKFYNPISEEKEYYIQNFMNDLEKIMKITKNYNPNEVYIYTASRIKGNLYVMILDIMLNVKNKNFGEIMRKLISDLVDKPDIQKFVKSNPDFIRKTIDDILSLTPSQQNRRLINSAFDELETRQDLIFMITRYIGTPREKIFIYREDEENIIDTNKKARFSRPYKPAIYLK